MGKFQKSPRFERKDFDRRGDSERPRFGAGRSRPPRRFNDGDSDRPRGAYQEKFDVTCDKCGRACQVPFKPTGNKPVYCSDCFRKDDSSAPRGRNQSSDVLDQINGKLDKILKLLEGD